jgi:hypothetical protein
MEGASRKLARTAERIISNNASCVVTMTVCPSNPISSSLNFHPAILGDQLQYGRALVLQQHFFLVSFHAADPHAEAFTDTFVGQAFPDKDEYLSAAWRKTECGHGLIRCFCLQDMQRFTNIARAEFFADSVIMVPNRSFGDEQFL